MGVTLSEALAESKGLQNITVADPSIPAEEAYTQGDTDGNTKENLQ